ncbi:hypothetical protein [Anaeromyxobacter diazotrophicus]|uniref:Outer membrane protein beta-barrel domain-containing protein n=1 Tax=Anaeromyxobacter diazotrophicus TaxID=2590199 RepID=A0A7I9VJ06_9BACT|nr:hypothetical protein [Anaeromyxobacter diazotrophicus]GEJ56391.1 hypothetical protein AMYX_11320 [Anaeromyxobacter diazotrophicus]
MPKRPLAVAVILALAAALPRGAAAEPAEPAPPRSSDAPPRAAPAPPRPPGPAPLAPRHRPRPAPAPRYPPGGFPRWYWDPYFYGEAPGWWGWGWGFGYYPLYPRPEYGYAPEDVSRVTTRLTLTGGGTLRHGGGAAGLALGLEGERLGFHLGVDGLYPGGRGSTFDSLSTFALLTAHLTVSLVTADVGRLRGEVGLSVLTWPDFYGPDAGAASLGPDVGLSGQLGLVGPLGVEGYARVTPVPVPIVDWQAALAVHVGPAAVTAGWRELAVHRSHGGNNNVASFDFAGPQVGVGVRF